MNLLALWVITWGAVARLVFWQLTLPIWKHFTVFNIFELGAFTYLSDFQSYSAVRMPFYDLFSAIGYLLTNSVLGVRSLTLFSVMIGIISLPFFYSGVAKLFDELTALFGLLLYAFYPKFLVLTATGFPEASAVAFVSFSLYALGEAQENDDTRGYAISGALATLSYLMFVPAVAFGILTTAYVYAMNQNGRQKDRTDFRPGGPTVAFAGIPFIFGVLYLQFGPVREMLSTVSGEWTNIATPLFAPDANYTLLEKVARYLLYMYADFWSIGRGFDKGWHVVRKFESFASFAGEWFPLLLIAYLGITAILSLCILVGFWRLGAESSVLTIYLFSWVSVFVVLHTVKNAGWTGVFQSRHVFPIFPALAIVFGSGVEFLYEYTTIGLSDSRIPNQFLNSPSRVSIALLVILAPMVGVSAVDSYYSGQNHELTDSQPAQTLLDVADPGANVGVVTVDDYQKTILFTQNQIRPTIYSADHSYSYQVETWTVTATWKVVPPDELGTSGIEYLYISECGELQPRQQRYLKAAKEIGTVVHQSTNERGGGKCTVRVFIVRLD